MRIFKNFLILLIVFIYSNIGNAELIGGHDRQRLNLLFSDLITQRLSQSPISISTTQFPLTLVSKIENQPMIDLYNVLVEEGYLASEKTIAEINDSQISATQAFRYTVSKTDINDRISVCSVLFDGIISIERLASEDSAVRYQVAYQWQARNLAPWLWAPKLINNADLAQIRRSETVPSQGEAILTWDVDNWALALKPLFN
jgi:hypothetical protein